MRDRELQTEIRSLIERFGISAVLRGLGNVADRGLPSRTRETKARSNMTKSSLRKTKPTAVEYVKKMNLPAERRELVLRAAEQFQSRAFLPSVGDVRNFFQIYDICQRRTNSRDGAMPRLFKHLAAMDTEDIREMLDKGTFAGPASLGPISDAIRQIGAERIRKQSSDLNPSGA